MSSNKTLKQGITENTDFIVVPEPAFIILE